jgi:hypothetical protein
MQLTDFLDCTPDRATQRAGRSDLVRIVRGQGEVEIEFAPRLDFGRMRTTLHAQEGGLVVEDRALTCRRAGTRASSRKESTRPRAPACASAMSPVLNPLRSGNLNRAPTAPPIA